MTSEKDSKEEEFVFEFYDEDYAESLEDEISLVEEEYNEVDFEKDLNSEQLEIINNIRGPMLVIAGAGEPLLYPHLDDLLEYTGNLGMNSIVFTNGIYLSEKRLWTAMTFHSASTSMKRSIHFMPGEANGAAPEWSCCPADQVKLSSESV